VLFELQIVAEVLEQFDHRGLWGALQLLLLPELRQLHLIVSVDVDDYFEVGLHLDVLFLDQLGDGEGEALHKVLHLLDGLLVPLPQRLRSLHIAHVKEIVHFFGWLWRSFILTIGVLLVAVVIVGLLLFLLLGPS